MGDRGWLGVTAMQKTFFMCISICMLAVLGSYILSVQVWVHICACIYGGPKLTSCVSIIPRFICWDKDPHWMQILQILAARIFHLPACQRIFHPWLLSSGIPSSCHNCSAFRVDSADPAAALILGQQTFDRLNHFSSPNSFFSLSQISCET